MFGKRLLWKDETKKKRNRNAPKLKKIPSISFLGRDDDIDPSIFFGDV